MMLTTPPFGNGMRDTFWVTQTILLSAMCVMGIMHQKPALADDKVMDYEFADKQYYAFVARPPALSSVQTAEDTATKKKTTSQKLPGILLVHDAYGQTEETRLRAIELANRGFVVLAVDMYGKGAIAQSPRDASRRANALLQNTEMLYGRFMAAHDLLTHLPDVDVTRIGALGYCLGGGVVLALAEMHADLKGVVSISGDLDYAKPEQTLSPKAPSVLVLQGGSDTSIPDVTQRLSTLKNRFKPAALTHKWVIYPGAGHQFYVKPNEAFAVEFKTNSHYNNEADHNSWNAMLTFFQDVLAKRSL